MENLKLNFKEFKELSDIGIKISDISGNYTERG